jgi:hypothetical protein
MQYLNKLKRESDLILMSGEHVEVYLLEDAINEADIGEWAVHFRQNYCLDSQIDILRRGTSLSRKEYLLKLVFPEEKPSSDDRRGPSTRSGDFAELLIADYLTYCENYFVPKDRYKPESVKLTD